VCERAPTPRLRQIATDNDAALCGITVAEMFAGVRTAADEAHYRAALADAVCAAARESWRGG
jgi:hypothetical protein